VGARLKSEPRTACVRICKNSFGASWMSRYPRRNRPTPISDGEAHVTVRTEHDQNPSWLLEGLENPGEISDHSDEIYTRLPKLHRAKGIPEVMLIKSTITMMYGPQGRRCNHRPAERRRLMDLRRT
jgi:hypothetical protein